jgi:penicillin amidase
LTFCLSYPLGADPERWSWGRLHQVHHVHPLSAVAGPLLARRMNVGPGPKGGSPLTVNNNGFGSGDFSVNHGATWRMVLDVGNWDACWTIAPPAQSGDPRSPHYRDHFGLWLKEQYVPLLYSRDAVLAALEHRIMLEPVATTAD